MKLAITIVEGIKNLSLKTLETLIYEEISKAKADQNKIRRAGVILSERDLNGFLYIKGDPKDIAGLETFLFLFFSLFKTLEILIYGK